MNIRDFVEKFLSRKFITTILSLVFLWTNKPIGNEEYKLILEALMILASILIPMVYILKQGSIDDKENQRIAQSIENEKEREFDKTFEKAMESVKEENNNDNAA